MMRDWAACYQQIDSLSAETGRLGVWLSPADADPLWDDFLRATPCGQYQQSSMWAEYKAGEGWGHHRVVLTDDSGIVGGFQLLWKRTALGRIGYVSKGPVVCPEITALVRQVGGLMVIAARQLGLSAMIVQQPDDTSVDSDCLQELGFVRSNPMGVIEATYLVEVSDGMEAVRNRMRPSLRKSLRKGQRHGTAIREGTQEDLPRFFDLMADSCQRQKTTPNPANVEAVHRLWRIFSRTQSIRLTLAACGEQTPAARLSMTFGDRVTIWKKGWDGSHGAWQPNELLDDDQFEWAHSHGYRVCDFCAISRPTALQILHGRPESAEDLRTRDTYNLRFGGMPKLLPPALVFFPNRGIRWVYRNTYARIEQWRH